MPQWAGWVVVAILCGIAEMLTPTFFIAWFGVGAIVAAILSMSGLRLAWQLSAFVVVSVVLVLSTKRLTAGWLRKGQQQKTNVYALEGRSALVTAAIPDGATGQVRVGHEVWSASSEGGGGIPAGVTVTVVKVDGVHLVVRASE